MIQSLYTAATAMTTHQANVDTVANNIANVGTTGYKRSRIDFKDALYLRMQSPVDNSPAMNLQRGSGALVNRTLKILEGGAIINTQEPTDMAIEGQGFFVLRNAEGGLVYTRKGDFKLSAEEDGAYLVDVKGNYVVDINGERINLGDASEFTIEADGTVRLDGSDGTQLTGDVQVLAVVDFANPAGLITAQDGYYAQGPNSGEPYMASGYAVRQGALENSNVDLSEEITRLIRAQRAYQFASRAITTADKMAEIANSIRT